MRRWLIVLALFGGLATGPGYAEGREAVSLARVRSSIAAPAAVESAKRLETLHARGDVAGLVAYVRTTVAVYPEPIAREWLLERAVHLLGALPEDPSARALCLELIERPPRVFVRVDPERPGPVPIYDVAAAARFALRRWAEGAVAKEMLADLRARKAGTIAKLGRVSAPLDIEAHRRAAVRAFESASDADLLAYRAELIAQVTEGADVDAVLAVFARRLRDAELYALLARHARAGVAVRALGEAVRTLPLHDARSVLEVAIERNELASPALLAMGGLARSDGESLRVLLDSLADPVRGPSAAAALGSLHDPGVSAALEDRLRVPSDELTRRHALLALRIDGTEAARAALSRYVERGIGSRESKREVSQWLGR